MLRIAWKNLLHDKLKLATAVAGVVFATVLMNLQVGMLLGFTDTITAVVARSPGDLWIMAKGTKNFDMVFGQPERRHYQALATEGVAWSSRLIVDFTLWRTPAGGSEQVIVLGIDPECPVGLPWAMSEGDVGEIFRGEGVIVDATERNRLGGPGGLRLGDRIEIKGHRARVVGFSKSVRSFTTTPYVFTSLRFARDFAHGLDPRTQVKYVVVGVAPGHSLTEVRARLLERLPEVEVLTRGEFMRRSVVYWLLGTGAGIMSILAAVLGLFVGGAIVGQAIYSQTMQKYREYGTFKALGGTNAELAGIILAQALFTALLGYATGVLVAGVVGRLMSEGRLLILMPPGVVVALGGVTALMCVAASLTSVARVVGLEPAIVFKA
ncbi:MAG: FtsX-like permease family protein [Planctomycetota bacterium]|nr:MAG: FtsX-like permease family protein [Planctomycetota bacterium]